MQVIDSVVTEERRAAPRLRPGLDVSMFAIDRRGGRSALRIGARGGSAPVRLHLYVDGDLVESWTTAPTAVTFELGPLGPGRHAVTARAIDAAGRWGGASILVE
jgi:hypothetical protein